MGKRPFDDLQELNFVCHSPNVNNANIVRCYVRNQNQNIRRKYSDPQNVFGNNCEWRRIKSIRLQRICSQNWRAADQRVYNKSQNQQTQEDGIHTMCFPCCCLHDVNTHTNTHTWRARLYIVYIETRVYHHAQLAYTFAGNVNLYVVCVCMCVCCVRCTQRTVYPIASYTYGV